MYPNLLCKLYFYLCLRFFWHCALRLCSSCLWCFLALSGNILPFTSWQFRQQVHLKHCFVFIKLRVLQLRKPKSFWFTDPAQCYCDFKQHKWDHALTCTYKVPVTFLAFPLPSFLTILTYTHYFMYVLIFLTDLFSCLFLTSTWFLF